MDDLWLQIESPVSSTFSNAAYQAEEPSENTSPMNMDGPQREPGNYSANYMYFFPKPFLDDNTLSSIFA